MAFSKGPKNPIYFDNCGMIFPWFSGKETPMNRKGDRNFGLVLNEEQAAEAAALNYQVKTYQRKDPETGLPDPEAEKTIYLKCKINFNSQKPPRIILVTCIDGVCKRAPMSEETITLLDSADVEHIDCKFRPYDREASDTRTAYVDNMYVYVTLDKFDAKHEDIPWANEELQPPPPENWDGE